MKATLIDHMGDDLTVVNAARVSFAKKSEWELEVWHGDPIGYETRNALSEKDRKLLTYLAKHNHWTPFAHPQVMLHLKMPMFVARQIDKHQVGFVVNEVSRRYVDDEPEFYDMHLRERAENVKQGSSNQYSDMSTHCLFQNAVADAEMAYRHLLADGVSPECARAVLPQSTYTEQYKTGSLYGWFNLCKLRMDSHAQKETQELAGQVSDIMVGLFPESWSALNERSC